MQNFRLVILAGLLSTLPCALFAQSPRWESLDGPIFPETRIHVRYADGDRLFFGSNTGLFRTTDGGKSWVILDATGGYVFRFFQSPGGVLFKEYTWWTGPFTRPVAELSRSTDRGENWTMSWGKVPPGGGMPEGWNVDWFDMTFGLEDTVYQSYGSYERQQGSWGNTYVKRSTDAGSTWTTVLEDHVVEPDYSWGRFDELHTQPNNVFARLVKGEQGSSWWRSPKVARSTDGGATWQMFLASRMMFHPPDNLLRERYESLASGTESNYGFIELSTDEGLSWTTTLTADSGFASLVSDDVSTLLVLRKPGFELFRSTDAGHTWTNLGVGPVGDPFMSVSFYGRTHLVGQTLSGGVYRSIDYGISWTPILDLDGKPLAGIVQKASDSLFVVADWRGNFLESEDAGGSWRSITCPFEMGKITSLLVLPSGSVLAGSTHAVSRRRTHEQWISRSLPNPLAPVLALSYQSGPRFLVGMGSWTNSTYYPSWHAGGLCFVDTSLMSPDYGFRDDLGGDSRCIFSSTNGTLLIGGTTIHRSTDQGSVFREVGPYAPQNSWSCLVEDSIHTLWAGNDSLGLYRSLDTGITWNVSNAGLNNLHVLCMTVAPGGDIYAGTRGGGIFRSTDNGTSWFSSGLSLDSVQALFAGGDGIVYSGCTNGVFASSDDGVTWSDTSSGLANKNIHALTRGPDGTVYCGTWGDGVYRHPGLPALLSPPRLVFPPDRIVFTGGLFTFSWSPVKDALIYHLQSSSDSLFTTDVFLEDSTLVDTSRSSLATDSTFSSPNGGTYFWRVRAKGATGWSGWSQTRIYTYSPCAIGGTESTPTTYALEQNYPNPFNASTTIRYALPKQSHVKLTVYNTLGEQLAELVNGETAAGYHEITLDGSRLSSGVYFYRLTAGNFTQTRKLLLLK